MKAVITQGTGLLGRELIGAAGPRLSAGAMIAVSPNPVTTVEFTRALGHAVHRPALLPIPKTALRIGVAERPGYMFEHTELAGALAAGLAAPGRRAA